MYKKLMGGKPTLEDLELSNPQLARGLKMLLEFDGDVEEVCVCMGVGGCMCGWVGGCMYVCTYVCITHATHATQPTHEPTLSTYSTSSTYYIYIYIFPQTFARSMVVSYEEYGMVKTHALKPGGDDIPVTNHNRQEYVQLYINYLLEDSISQQVYIRGISTQSWVR